MKKENPKGKLFLQCMCCDKTLNLLLLETKIIHKEKFVEINGQSIYLTYYDCPHCGQRNFVQIDDEISLHKLTNVRSVFVKSFEMNRKGKDIPRKQSDKFKKARKDLTIYRMELMRKFTGKTVMDKTGKSYELFFVQKFI